MGVIRFKIRTVADRLEDSGNQGSCAAITDLIFDPGTPFLLQCRPAAIELTDFSTSGFTSPGVISALYTIGSRIYGMIQTGSPANEDRPFCWDNAAQAFVPITGSGFPVSQPTSGDWTPPSMIQSGSFLIVTHPGFSVADPIGWIGLAAFTLSTTGYVSNGSDLVVNVGSVTNVATGYGISGTDIPSSTTISAFTSAAGPFTITGVTQNGSANLVCCQNPGSMVDGQYITGPGIPDLTTVSSFTASATGPFTATGNTTNSSTTVGTFTDTTDAVVGQNIVGSGIQNDTTIASVSAGSSVSHSGNCGSGSSLILNMSSIASVSIGQTITDSLGAVPSLTTVLSTASAAGPYTTTGTATAGSVVLTSVASISNVSNGQYITGSAITFGTTVAGSTGSASNTVNCQTFSGGYGLAALSSISGVAQYQAASGSDIPSGAYVTQVNSSINTNLICSWTNGNNYLTSSGASAAIIGTVIQTPADLSGIPILNVVGNQIFVPAGSIGDSGTSQTVNFQGSSIVISQPVSTGHSGHNCTFTGPTIILSAASPSSASGMTVTFGGNSVTMSKTAGATFSGDTFTFSTAGSITLSKAATATQTGVSLLFGGSTVVMSANATASASNITFTYGGSTITMSANATGTVAANPLVISSGGMTWTNGNTTTHTLPGIPQFVSLFSGRAYYALGNLLYYSDSGAPTTMTNADQILTVGDTSIITGLAGLPMTTAISGIIQALIAFKENNIWQITGDAATSNLALNTLNIASGSIAPNSIATTPQGLVYMDHDGIRIIQPTGAVQGPLNDIRLPFINATYPSRVAAASNGTIYRITVPNALTGTTQNYWFDFSRNGWTGPHSFVDGLVKSFGEGFVMARNDYPGKLFYSDIQQLNSSTFIELGTQMNWKLLTTPMADSGNAMKVWSIIATQNVSMAPKPNLFQYQAIDEQGNTLAECYLPSLISPPAEWDSATFDQNAWQNQFMTLMPRQLPWTNPLVFNRLTIEVDGISAAGVRLGAFEIQTQDLGYPQS